MTFLRSAGSAVLAALLAVGCTVDNAKETATWRRHLDEHVPPAPALEPGQVLTLQQALAMANARSEQLALSGENYLQSLIDKDRAVSALLPSISLAPMHVNMQKFSAPPQVLQLFPIRYTDVPVQLAAQFSATDVAKVARAEVIAQYQLAVLLGTQSDILVKTGQVYYQCLQLEAQIRVLENSVKVQAARVRDMEDKAKAGIVRPLDVAQTQANAAGTRASLVDARNRLVTAHTALAFLVAVPSLENPLSDTLQVPAVPPLEDVQKAAAEHRQDLLAARALLSAAERGLSAAVAEYYPSVSVNFDEWLTRQSFPPDSRWFFSVGVYLPIFSGGRIHADVRTAYSLLRQAKEYLSLTGRQVAQDVEVAYSNLQSSDLRLLEYRTEVQAAREAFALANQAYDAGVATYLERLIAQDSLLMAELQLTAEEFNRKILYLQLTRQAGLLVDEFSLRLGQSSARDFTAEIAGHAEENQEQ
jgi:outer membrane protein TolC